MPDHSDFDLDEAISADLDDELAPFATEWGVDLATLRAQMAEQPEYPDRLAALETARRSLRAPVEPLDAVTRARLLRAAPITAPRPSGTGTGTPDQRGRAWRILGAAAALVLVVGGGAALLRDTGSSDSAKSTASSGGRARVRTGALGDLGSLDPKKLDSLIGGGTGAPSTPASPEERQTSSSKGSDAQRSVAPAPNADQPNAATDAAVGASVTPQQVGACRAEYAKVGNVRFSGTGDYQGRPAVVLGVETGGRTIVFVVAAADCSEVLVSVSR